jgi:hypothetical protein
MLRARECVLIPFPFVVFTFGLTVESIKELGGVSFDLFIMPQKIFIGDK